MKFKSAIILSLLGVLFATQAQAKVFAKFHPYDSTLTLIADYIKNAERSVDIAAYNIDSNKRNPVIAAIASKPVQTKLKSANLAFD